MSLRVSGFPKSFMKKRIFVYFLIITICLLHLLVPDIVFGQSVQVFNKYEELFKHPDVHEFFPDVLNAFKDPENQGFLNSALISRFAGTPRYLRNLYEETDDSILALLLLDEQFQELFKDPQFHALVAIPTQVDELVRLIQQSNAETNEPRTDCEPSVPAPPKATTLTIVSGFGQQGEPGNPLPNRVCRRSAGSIWRSISRCYC